MSRREIAWRIEMAAEKMKRRGLAGKTSAPVDEIPKFTEEESKTLDKELAEAQERVKARFKKTQ